MTSSSTAPATNGNRAPETIPTTSRLPSWYLLGTGVAGALLAALGQFLVTGRVTVAGIVIIGYLAHVVLAFGISAIVEDLRWAKDRLATVLVAGAFGLAILPLGSLLFEVVARGLDRLVNPYFGYFWQHTMSGVFGGMVAGGIKHAIIGTLIITLCATVISVPIGFFTSVYLVEYGRPYALARGITFFVDVMTGIPSIVAGLFAFSLFTLVFGDPGMSNGIMGAVALSVLMIPTVVRSSEEMLRLVPNELREASYALGVPKWLTIVKVVLRTSIAGLTTSVTLAIARVIGETAPLLVTVGTTPYLNLNPFQGQMMTLPTYINDQYNLGSAICAGGTDTMTVNGIEFLCDTGINLDRAWGAALTLILIVMILNLFARLVSVLFAPKAR